MYYRPEEKPIWKVDLNTVFPYITSTFREGWLIIRIKKGEEHTVVKDSRRNRKVSTDS